MKIEFISTQINASFMGMKPEYIQAAYDNAWIIAKDLDQAFDLMDLFFL